MKKEINPYLWQARSRHVKGYIEQVAAIIAKKEVMPVGTAH